MKVKISKLAALAMLSAFVVAALGGCDRSGSRDNSAAQNKPSAFEKDLDSVRRNNFQKVYVISRPDGGSLNADDKAYLKTNMPIETTMRILTDADRRVIVGTNFDFKPEHVEALTKRFKVEDYTN
jgi:basic membrane lipoprotein Med (substrate-binding protein (PBP1-ABC) superfamily)